MIGVLFSRDALFRWNGVLEMGVVGMVLITDYQISKTNE